MLLPSALPRPHLTNSTYSRVYFLLHSPWRLRAAWRGYFQWSQQRRGLCHKESFLWWSSSDLSPVLFLNEMCRQASCQCFLPCHRISWHCCYLRGCHWPSSEFLPNITLSLMTILVLSHLWSVWGPTQLGQSLPALYGICHRWVCRLGSRMDVWATNGCQWGWLSCANSGQDYQPF